MDLEEETAELTTLLVGKTVVKAKRLRVGELLIEFTDGTRLFVDAHSDAVECSVAGGISD